MSLTKHLKSYFLRGLAVLLPSVLTIWILVLAFGFIQDKISVHISEGLVWLIMKVQGDGGLTEKELTNIFVTGTAGSVLGFLIAVVAVCIVGAILASVVGRALWHMIEQFIMNTPVLKRIYPYIKQITDFVLTQEQQQKMFSRVVAVEYPRKGLWSVGLVTGSGIRQVTETVQKEFVTVLIPNSPTPVTGFVIMVPKEQTIALDITIEEAFRYILSAGVVIPTDRQVTHLPQANSKDKEEQDRIPAERS